MMWVFNVQLIFGSGVTRYMDPMKKIAFGIKNATKISILDSIEILKFNVNAIDWKDFSKDTATKNGLIFGYDDFRLSSYIMQMKKCIKFKIGHRGFIILLAKPINRTCNAAYYDKYISDNIYDKENKDKYIYVKYLN